MMLQRINLVNTSRNNACVHTYGNAERRDPRKIIAGLMQARGFPSQRQLAAAAGISQPTLNRYLDGKSDDMEMSTWRALAEALEVTVSQLLGESPIHDDPSVAAVVRAMERLSEPYRHALVAAANAFSET